MKPLREGGQGRRAGASLGAPGEGPPGGLQLSSAGTVGDTGSQRQFDAVEC